MVYATVFIDQSIFLSNGECMFLKEKESRLKETRAVRKNSGSGLGFRVMKGVYLGGYSGKSESHQEWRILDSGELVLTNKKIIFRGNNENRTIPIDKIVAVKVYTDGIELTTESKSKSSIFAVKNPYIWNIALTILRSGKDPLSLGEIDIDVQVKE